MNELEPNEREETGSLAEDGAEVSEESVRAIKELIQTVLKTKRAYEMYPSNNPILIKFQEDLTNKFESIFEAEDRITLIIRQQDIYFKGQPVYHNSEKEDNLALFFYKDGLREITITAGFSDDEIMDFLDVIRARPETSTESFDDDIVTRLWEKDFMHLSYYVVEEYSEGEAIEEDEVARLLSQSNRTTDGALTEAYQDAAEEEGSEEIFTPLETISMGFKGVFSLGEEEVKYLKEEMEGLTDESFLTRAVDVLFESLYLDKGTSDFDILMGNLDSALRYIIDAGRLGTAAMILMRFREIEGQKDEFNQKEIARIRLSLGHMESDSGIKKIGELLNRGQDVSPEDFQLYLSQLGRSSIVPLFSLMGEIQDIKYRKALIESIVPMCHGNMEALNTAIKDKRWQVVRNVVAVLGRIGDKGAVEPLKQALNHAEPNVRREAVRSLGMIGGPKAGDALLFALEDQDPQIRIAALRFMPRAQSFSVLDSLMDIANLPDFSDKSIAEKRALFEVLAEIGQDRILQFLIKLLRKKALFESAKKEEIRACAAYGLGNIHQKEALDVLEKELTRSKKGSIVSEAISYSINKLARPEGRPSEA